MIVLIRLLALVCAGWAYTALADVPVFQGPPPTPVATPAPAVPIPAPTPAAPPASTPARSAADLEKLATPIALHPDPLISIILPAATYPVEVVQAARFVKNTNNIPNIDAQPWDDKVKAVAKFPELISKMDTDLKWTVELGNAFLEQPLDLMNAIQDLRIKAQKTGVLKTTPQQIVTVTNAVVERTYENQIVYVTNTVVQVQPASKETVYVPSYPSTVYVDDDASEAAATFISFGVGIAFGAAIWGDCDWHYGGCYWGHYPPPPPPYPPPYHPPPGAPPPQSGQRPPASKPPATKPPGNRPPTVSTTPRWQPDQNRLRTSGSGGASVSSMEARGWGPQTPRTSAGPTISQRPSNGAPGGGSFAGAGAVRPSTGTAGIQPSGGGNRIAPPAGVARTPSATPQPSASRSASRPSPSFSAPARSSSTAFSGMSSGASARNAGSRGAASRGSSGGSRGGGRR